MKGEYILKLILKLECHKLNMQNYAAPNMLAKDQKITAITNTFRWKYQYKWKIKQNLNTRLYKIWILLAIIFSSFNKVVQLKIVMSIRLISHCTACWNRINPLNCFCLHIDMVSSVLTAHWSNKFAYDNDQLVDITIFTLRHSWS